MKFPIALALAAAALLPSTSAAAAQRTFVASSGNDAAACSLAAPCRSFGAAMTQTDPGGEIVVLDSAGYGVVTVNQSVTIVAPPGVYAGVSVFSGANGVDIATPGIHVVLRGLTINGQGGTHGIALAAGAGVVVEGCVVSNMAGDAVRVTSANAIVTLKDSVFRSNGANGIAIVATAVRASVDNVRSEANVQSGVLVDNGAVASVSRSRFDGNQHGSSVLASDGASTSVLALSDSVAADNANRGINAFAAGGGTVRAFVTSATLSGNANAGLVADAAAGGKALVSVTTSTLSGNGTGAAASNGTNPGDVTLAITASSVSRNAAAGLSQSGAAIVRTRQDNTVHDNNPDSAGTLTPLPAI